MSEQNQLAERQPTSVKDYLALPAYRDRFHEVMGKRANQFMAAIVASSQLPGLRDAEPRSVIAAAMVAATLDLPVNPTLGQAHLVAYADNQGTKVAQFQIGYKGLIQLALRSGQYKRLNSGPVNAEVFKGYDLVGEPSLDWTAYDPTLPVAGYFCAFETLNGFVKVVYWTKAQAEAHAKRFSRAYAKGYATPWKSDFDSMATKTVIKAALGKWGLLSVEMQKAVVHDQGVQDDVDSDVKYVDNGTDETVPGDPAPDRPAPPPRESKGAKAAKENAAKRAPAPEVVVPAEEQQATEAPKAAEPVAAPTPKPVEQSKAEAPKAEVPKAVVPRASLNDGETITVPCEVVAVRSMEVRSGGETKPSVRVELKGAYLGKDILHFGGGEYVLENGEKVRIGAPETDWKTEPLPVWKVGAKVNVTLQGKKLSSGEVRTYIKGAATIGGNVEPVEEPS